MRALLALLAALAAAPVFAKAPPEGAPPETDIVAALTQEVVEIRSNFDGAELVLYGAARGLREGDDITVVVRGPERDLRVMRKQRSFGIWINRAPVRFESVPGYYAVAATRPLSEFATFTALRRNEIGADHLRLSAPETERTETRFGVADVRVSDLGAEIVDYRDAIIRAKADEGLIAERAGGVELLDGGLFRAQVILPPTTPVGEYAADVYLFRDGVPIASRRTTLNVQKAGVERAIYDLAHNQPALYGLLAVIFAALAGWAAAEVFRRR
ncbi:MAG: TIGR02186 family protein [Pseudomonadota bacterium]